jgi:hypothetical protein
MGAFWLLGDRLKTPRNVPLIPCLQISSIMPFRYSHELKIEVAYVKGRPLRRVCRFILEISVACKCLIYSTFVVSHGLKIFAPKVGVFLCVKCLVLLALVASHCEAATVNKRSSFTLDKARPPPPRLPILDRIKDIKKSRPFVFAPIRSILLLI